jgi:hypothetical protein
VDSTGGSSNRNFDITIKTTMTIMAAMTLPAMVIVIVIVAHDKDGDYSDDCSYVDYKVPGLLGTFPPESSFFALAV